MILCEVLTRRKIISSIFEARNHKMLGISGQAKSISQRTGDGKKVTGKLPTIPPTKQAKPEVKAKSAPKGKGKRRPVVAAQQETKVAEKGHDTSGVGKSQTVLEIAKVRLGLPSGAIGDTGTVKVRFNHYNKSFPIHNGVLKWADVDEDYCLSFVYKGNFTRNLVFVSSGSADTGTEDEVKLSDHDVEDGRRLAKHDEHFTYYINIADKSEYRLDVLEDPTAGIGAEGLRMNTGPLKSSELGSIQTSNAIKSTSRAMDNITAELKSIAVTELNDAHAKDLIERRDLEDILYSG